MITPIKSCSTLGKTSALLCKSVEEVYEYVRADMIGNEDRLILNFNISKGDAHLLAGVVNDW